MFCRYNVSLTMVIAPVQDFVEYEINEEHSTDHSKHTKYSGFPTPEQNAAWSALMKRM